MSNAFFKIKNSYNSLTLTKKAVIWFTLATIIQNGISFLVTPIYTRILSDSEYGIYSVFQSWQQIISIISIVALDRCIPVGFMKFSNEKEGFLSSIQTLMTLLVFVWTALVCIFPNFFENLIKLPVYMVITMLLVSLMNNTLANWSWYQRYNYNYKKLASVTVVSTLLMQIISVISVIILPFENKGNVMVMSMSLARILMYGIVYYSVFVNGKSIFNKQHWCFSLKFSLAVVPHALAQIILNSSDRIMIDNFCGREETAFYSVTYSSAMVLNTIMTSISSAVQPWYYEKIKVKDFESIKKLTNNLLILSAFFSVGVSLFAPEILGIMAPSSYHDAIWVFPSIAASVYFNSMYLYFANFESYYEKPFYFSIATTTGAVVNIILNFFMIPKFGFVAAGYTTLLCYILFAIMHYIFMRKVCNEKLEGKVVFDVKFIILLSLFVLTLTLGVTILYKNIVIRYMIILFIALLVIYNRKKIINELNRIIKKK